MGIVKLNRQVYVLVACDEIKMNAQNSDTSDIPYS